jgi:hypothetical protein
MKSFMEVLLFQWSQVFKKLEWKPMIDVWFGKFKVSLYLNNFFCYVNSVYFFMLIQFNFNKLILLQI